MSDLQSKAKQVMEQIDEGKDPSRAISEMVERVDEVNEMDLFRDAVFRLEQVLSNYGDPEVEGSMGEALLTVRPHMTNKKLIVSVESIGGIDPEARDLPPHDMYVGVVGRAYVPGTTMEEEINTVYGNDVGFVVGDPKPAIESLFERMN